MILLAIPFPEISPFAFQIPPFDLFGFHIGPLGIRWYALGYITGIIIAWNILLKLAKTPDLWRDNKPPFTGANIDDFVFYATLGILIGGRLGYVLFYQPVMLLDPLSILRTWEGGMSFHGGISGVILAVLYVSWRNKINIISFADAVALASPLGIGIVRIANFVNQELWGRPTDVPWAFIFDTDPLRLPRHPSQLYEAMLEGFLLFAILCFAVCKLKSLKNKGLTAGIFLTGYGLSRIILENVRQPDGFMPDFPFGLTMGMMLSMPILALGIVFLTIGIKNRNQDKINE